MGEGRSTAERGREIHRPDYISEREQKRADGKKAQNPKTEKSNSICSVAFRRIRAHYTRFRVFLCVCVSTHFLSSSFRFFVFFSGQVFAVVLRCVVCFIGIVCFRV